MQRAKTITSITYVDDLGSTPARVNRITGKMYINLRMWRDLSKEHRLFIMLHELAHVVLNTKDEVKADGYAFKHYVRLGYSLTESIKALTRVLNFTNAEHYQRVEVQTNRARLYDYDVNKNQAFRAWFNKFYKRT